MKLQFLVFSSILFLVCFLPFHVKAQQSFGGIPLWNGNNKDFIGFSPYSYIAKNTLVSDFIREDSLLANRKDIPFRFGKEIPVKINMTTHGLWTQVAGGKVWRVVVGSKNALSINLIFNKFRLVAGSRLFLINADGSKWIGALDNRNNLPENVLGTMPLPGEAMIVEYFVPENAIDLGELEIGTVVHGYKNVFSFGESGSCQININCPQAADWALVKKATVVMLNGGSFCTGALINNTSFDGRPYILTANHCYSRNVAAWSVAFNYESPSCTSQDGNFNQSISGMVLRAKSNRSDFMLLELNSRPPSTYNAYYAGWDRSGNTPLSGACIHHPSGDIKKFSPYKVPGVGSTMEAATTWKIYWDLNTCTEPGSSGSPLFNEDKRIVGQLFGGPSACGVITDSLNDEFGKLSESWETAVFPTPANQLKPWLDPLNTGLLAISGRELGCTTFQSTLPLTYDFDSINIIPRHFNNVPSNAFGWQAKPIISAYQSVGNCILAQGGSTSSITRGSKQSIDLPVLAFNQAGGTFLYFDIASAYYGANNEDTLQVLYSTDCGSSFSLLYQNSGQNLATVQGVSFPSGFVPNAGQWRTDSIPLLGNFLLGTKVQFRFVFRKGNGYDLYLDNISVKRPPLQALQIDFVSPKKSCVGTTIDFINSSANEATSYTWSVNGLPIATYSDLRKFTYTFNQPRSYEIALSGSIGNKAATRTYVVEVSNTIEKPFPERQFFADTSCLGTDYVVYPNSTKLKSWNVKSSIQGNSLYKPLLVIDNLTTNNYGAADTVVFPFVNWRGKYRPRLSFKYAYRFDQTTSNTSKDTLQLVMVKNCGSEFNLVWKMGGASLATVPQSSGLFLPNKNQFVKVYLELKEEWLLDALNPNNSSLTRFALISKSGNGNYIFIDSIRIDTAPACPKPPIATVVSNCSRDYIRIVIPRPENSTTYTWKDLKSNIVYSGSELSLPPDFAGGTTYSFEITAFSNECTSSPIILNGAILPSPDTGTIIKFQTDSLRNGLRWVAANPRNIRSLVWYCDSVLQYSFPRNTPELIPEKSGNYWVKATASNGCVSLSKPFKVNFSNEIIAWPNPTNGLLSLSIQSVQATNLDIEVVDILGKLVIAKSRSIPAGSSVTSIPEFESIASGLYSVKINLGREVSVKHIIKE